MNILPRIIRPKKLTADQEYQALIRQEAKMGGTLFGPIPAGHRREFFCLDEYTWVWHEEWTDQTGTHQTATTRYRVRPGGVLKIQGDKSPQPLSFEESVNLYEAVEAYERRVVAMYGGQSAYAA
ncbi:hypothetical protein H7171_02880 [Candidatus Saccharibacteria bacterium]|nr:hypothetical protein [Candidatus Saccharibacteria bacterium]